MQAKPKGGVVFRSTDSGTSWQTVGHPEARLKFFTRSGSVLYAATGFGLYRVADGETDWQRILDAEAGFNALAVAPSSSNVLYALRQYGEVLRSDDRGATWVRVDSGLSAISGLSTEVVQSVAVSPSNPQHVLLGVPGGINRSENGGATWSRTGLFRGSEPETPYINSILFDPSDPARVYACCGGLSEYMYRSGDGGRTWPRASGKAERIERIVTSGRAGELYCRTALNP